MKNLRKTCAIILALVMIFVSFANVFAAGEQNTYTGNFYHTGIHVPYEFTYDDDYLIYGNNEIYYTELAKLCLVASAAQYEVPNQYLDRTNYGSKFYTQLGFTDISTGMKTSTTVTEADDYKQNLTIAHKNVTKNNNNYELIIVAASGTENAAEWKSNADIGAETETYKTVLSERYDMFETDKPTTLEGLAPLWTNHDMHKGFCVTANYVKQYIDAYVENYIDPTAKKIILITGHSRAAAIANILGTIYEDDENYKSFTYTFASPNTTTASDEVCKSYTTIFNIINQDDLITKLPMANIGFKRYGVDLINYGTSLAEDYKNYTNREYTYNAASLSNVLSFFNNFISSREEYYEVSTNHYGTYYNHYSTVEECDNNLLPPLFGLCLSFGGLFEWERTYTQGYTYKITYSLAYLFRVLCSYVGTPEMVSKLQLLSPAELIKKINSTTPLSLMDMLEISSVATAVSDGTMVNSHSAAIYYLIANNDFGYDQDSFMPDTTGSIFSNNFTTIPVVVAVIAIGAFVAIRKSQKVATK